MPHRESLRHMALSISADIRASQETPMLITLFSRTGAEWGTAVLVFLVSLMAGRYAAQGMDVVQWAGAVTAVLGSVTVAVWVRIAPTEAKVTARQDD